jgi:hypothetical protein
MSEPTVMEQTIRRMSTADIEAIQWGLALATAHLDSDFAEMNRLLDGDSHEGRMREIRRHMSDAVLRRNEVMEPESEVACPNCPSYNTELAILPDSWRCLDCGHTFAKGDAE